MQLYHARAKDPRAKDQQPRTERRGPCKSQGPGTKDQEPWTMSPAGTKKHMHAKSYKDQEPRTKRQRPRAMDQEPCRDQEHMLRAKDPEPRTERQGPRAKDQERRTNSHSPRMKDHARAKNQEPWTRRNQIYHARTKYIYIYIYQGSCKDHEPITCIYQSPCMQDQEPASP